MGGGGGGGSSHSCGAHNLWLLVQGEAPFRHLGYGQESRNSRTNSMRRLRDTINAEKKTAN